MADVRCISIKFKYPQLFQNKTKMAIPMKSIEVDINLGDQFHEFSYFYFEDNILKIADSCSEVPDGEGVEFCKLGDAIHHIQHRGCCGRSQHIIQSDYHRLCLEVLRWAVKNRGELFPLVYRGYRSSRPDSEYKILFGSRDKEVAAFYGPTIKEYRNIRGILAKSSIAKSVKTNSWHETDDEIIFFPDL